MKLRVELDLTHTQLKRLELVAIKLGYLRVNPNAVWTLNEAKEQNDG